MAFVEIKLKLSFMDTMMLMKLLDKNIERTLAECDAETDDMRRATLAEQYRRYVFILEEITDQLEDE